MFGFVLSEKAESALDWCKEQGLVRGEVVRRAIEEYADRHFMERGWTWNPSNVETNIPKAKRKPRKVKIEYDGRLEPWT